MGKSKKAIIVLAFASLILITSSLLQLANNLVENNNGFLYIKNVGQKAYAEDDDDDDKDIEEYNIDADKQHD
jgi:uncharacterized protein YxeA